MSSTALADEIVRLIQSGVSVSNLKQKYPPDALADAIISLIRSSLNSGKNLKTVLKPEVAREISASLGTGTPKSNTARLILKLIQNSLGPNGRLKKETAEQVVKHVGPPNSNAILKIIINALGPPEQAANIVTQAPPRPTNNTANLIFRIIMNLFKTNGKMDGPAPLLNFYPAKYYRETDSEPLS